METTYTIFGGSSGSVESSSALPSTFEVKTANYTAVVGDLVLADATAGAFTVTLPTGAAEGNLVIVKKTDASANAVAVAGTIDGDAGGASLAADGFGLLLESDGADAWQIVGVTAATADSTAALDAHIADTTAAHAASAISFAPNGSIAATTVQTAIVEVRDEAQPVDSDLTAIAALTTTSYGRAFLALADAAAGRTALGLGTAATSASGDFQAADSDLTAIAALTTTSFGRGLLALADAAALLAAAGAQAADADLTALAAIAPSNDDIVQRKAGAWTNRTPAQVKTDLALAKGDVGLGNVDNTADTAKPVSTAQQAAIDAVKGLPTALTGAVAATRYVGGTASVAPTTGTFAIGDFVVTQNAKIFACTVAGSPGTWVQVGGGGAADTLAKTLTGTGVLQVGDTASTTAATGIQIGTDATANLYRTAAGRIKTDGALFSAGGIRMNSGSFLSLDASDTVAFIIVGSGIATLVGALSVRNGLRVQEAANTKQGAATLVAGTVVVSNTSITANSRIFLTAQDNNSTGSLRVSARTVGTSFTITSSNAGDTGVVAFEIFEPGN